MRIYQNCYDLTSEILREVWEMGEIVHPHSMQNKIVKGNTDFQTKEVINYSYCLLSRERSEFLFYFDNAQESVKWVHAEFEERVSGLHLNPGEAWKLRKDLWAQFLNAENKQDYTYSERIGSQVKRIIDELAKNPSSRQCVLSIWNPEVDIYGLGGKQRVPCSIYYQFLYRSGALHIIYNQRSADVVTHFGNDVWLAWQMMLYVAKELGAKPGYLYHNITSLHAYRKDWDTLKTGVSNIAKYRNIKG